MKYFLLSFVWATSGRPNRDKSYVGVLGQNGSFIKKI